LSILTTRKPPLTKAMYFNGVDNYVQAPDSPLLRLYQMTLECLAYFSALPFGNYPGLISKTRDGYAYTTNYALEGVRNQKSIHLAIADGSRWAEIISGPLSAYTWYHIAATYDLKYLRLYINGTPVTPVATTLIPVVGSYPLWIGHTPNYAYFNGYIAFVRLYNRALSQSEIIHNYRNPNNPVRDGLVLWLDARSVSGSTWYDLSGNGNNGTIYGATQVSLPNPVGGGT